MPWPGAVAARSRGGKANLASALESLFEGDHLVTALRGRDCRLKAARTGARDHDLPARTGGGDRWGLDLRLASGLGVRNC